MQTNRLFFVLWCGFSPLISCSLSAQQVPNQSCDVPLVVTRYVPSSGAVELVNDLSAKDVTVHLDGLQGTVESLSVDNRAKRAALIIDASRSVSKDEWKLETEMAASLIGHARAEDRFALLLVGADAPTGPLLPANEIEDRLQALASNRPSAADPSERIYDSLLAAADRLNPPEFGDAIFLFGHPEDSGSSATADQILELVLRNKLRFYAMSFTDPLRGKLPPGFDLNKPLPENLRQPGADKIAHSTGYFYSFHSIEALGMPGQMTLLKGFLGDLYAGIAEPYRLRISLSSATGRNPLEVVILDPKNRKINQNDVHYPHFIYPCTSSAPVAH